MLPLCLYFTISLSLSLSLQFKSYTFQWKALQTVTHFEVQCRLLLPSIFNTAYFKLHYSLRFSINYKEIHLLAYHNKFEHLFFFHIKIHLGRTILFEAVLFCFSFLYQFSATLHAVFFLFRHCELMSLGLQSICQ